MRKGKPWLDRYDTGVPHRLVYPVQSIHDLLKDQAKRTPDKIAIIRGERSISYGNLQRQSRNFAQNLVRLGVKQGEVVGICLENTIEFVVSFFGILQAGGIVAAMNPGFPRRELQFQLKNTGLHHVVTTHDKLEDLVPDKSVTDPFHFIVVDRTPVEKKYQKPNSFYAIIQDLPAPIDLPIVDSLDPAVIQFSGGTTGMPKAALGSHANIVANVTQFRHWLVNLENERETFLITIPLYHVYGLVLGLILGVATGATLVFIENPGNINTVIKAIQEHAVSYFPAVPSIFYKINQYLKDNEDELAFQTIKACISGSAPLIESIRRDFEGMTGASLVEGYGLSEAPTATHCNPVLGEHRNGSIGLPLPDVDCRIVSLDNKQMEVGEGEEGELLIRGPQVMTGYYHEPHETSLTLQDGWLHTGDVARMDVDGYFYISGRIKDLIKVHGMQVWPTEVEQVINQHPDVLECAVAGVPDERSGERVKAWVVLKPDHIFDLKQLKVHCEGKLAAYKIPREMQICQSLPKTPIGKVLRRELFRQHMERQQ